MSLNRKKRTQGFSLIELLIVVTIILILAAIAIPKLLTVKQTANSTAAVANTKSMLQALTAYDSQYNTYPATLSLLGGAPGTAPTATTAELVDPTLAAAISAATSYQGYFWTYTPAAGTPTVQFTMDVSPASTATGNRYFFTDESDVIRWKDGGLAAVGDPPIGTNAT
ncbi:MAG: prepilin-type N-terminal cleavage/methylation domain-containing protein [Terriglobales bacterium]